MQGAPEFLSSRIRVLPTSLEDQLQRELELTREGGRRQKLATRGTVFGSLEKNLVRVREIGAIENIEHLGPERQLQCLTDCHVLEQRRVDIEQARTTQRSARHVSKGSLERQHEGFRIEPFIGSTHDHRPLKVRIPVRYVGITGIAGSSSVRASQRCEGESTRSPEARIPLPAAYQLVHDASGAACGALRIPGWQPIAGGPAELVEAAEGCASAARPFRTISTTHSRGLVAVGRRRRRGLQS